MPAEPHIAHAEELFKKALEHLKSEFSKLQIGRASASLVEGILVEAYGATQPLKALASVIVSDAKSLQIQPWDKSTVSAIEKAILEANIGVTPINDGHSVRISFPPLTEERRKELVKVVHRMAEEGHISVRQARGDGHAAFKELEKKGTITEDDARRAEKHLQEKVDHYNKEIDELAKRKEQDVMTV